MTSRPDSSGKSIKTSYIEGFYHGNVTRERIEQIQAVMDDNEYINTDFEPRIMNIVFQEWFMKHGTSPRAFLLVIFGIDDSLSYFYEKRGIHPLLHRPGNHGG